MNQCIVCHEEIADRENPDILNIYSGTNWDGYRRLFDKLGVEATVSFGRTVHYLHYQCVQEHATLLHPDHQAQWLEWRIRMLEKERDNTRTLIQDISNAISHIEPTAYFQYIEQPSLDRRKQ